MKEVHVISLGAGVQSSVMSLMAAKGELLPMPEHLIFADTQWEPPNVYEHLKWLTEELLCLTDGFMKVHQVTAGNIREDAIRGTNTTGQKFSAMPTFVGDGGMGRRQCTSEYKIRPVNTKMRRLVGVEKHKKFPKGMVIVKWMGISVDEPHRMKDAMETWVENYYPLVNKVGYSRSDCLQWFSLVYPGRELARSACIGCPYHDDGEWRDMKKGDPESFKDAVEFDNDIRCMEPPQHLHRSRKPLDEVDFSSGKDGKVSLWGNECEGMCGI